MRKFAIIFTASLIAGALIFQGCSKKKKYYYIPDDEPSDEVEVVHIGVLASLTGNWNTLGVTSHEAVDIALDEINKYLKHQEADFVFDDVVYDTKLDADLALKYMAEAKSKGVTFIIGPQSSAEAGAVKDYADKNDMIVISQGSTAGSLSIAGDNLFRFCPADDVEGKAMANYMHAEGIRSLVTLARNDAGNLGLQLATGAAFQDLGGTVIAQNAYSTEETDFTATLNALKTELDNLLEHQPATEVAVYLASFDECVDLFKMAAGMDPVFAAVRWFGGDGTALSAVLLSDNQAAAFAHAVNYQTPAYGLPTGNSPSHSNIPIAEVIEARTGIKPDAFALAAYDATWVAAMSYFQSRTTTEKPVFDTLYANFVKKANSYTGITGSTKLNAAGDRATGSYDMWGLVEKNGGYVWEIKGKAE
jgi:branched-chain amino acid transport system substrate-binding protein